MLTTPTPATVPANATVPGPAAYTVAPGVPARSTPRCPGSHGCGGGWNGRVTRGAPASGHRNAPGEGAGPGGGAVGTTAHPAPVGDAADSSASGNRIASSPVNQRTMTGNVRRTRSGRQPPTPPSVDGEGA